MNVTTVSDYLELFLAICAVIAALAGFVRWGQRGLERKILAEIKDATKQIQPKSNGGLSLTDLHYKVETLIERQAIVVNDVKMLKESVLQLEDEMEGLQ